MGSIARYMRDAMDAHRQAMAYVRDVMARLDALAPDPGAAAQAGTETRRLAAKLHDLARSGLTGWLGAPLGPAEPDLPLGQDATAADSMCLRIGDASPAPDCMFWAVAPFVGVGHIAIDVDSREPAVAAWLRGVLLRTLGALPQGGLRVLPVDGATLGAVFTGFRPLVEAEAWAAPAADVDGLRRALDEAEQQIKQVQAGTLADPPALLVAVAALPAGTGRGEWARLAAIAHAGPAARVHLLLAGWPPATAQGEPAPRLAYTTQLTSAGDGWYRMSEPPGPYQISVDGSGLAAPLRLDPGATPEVVAAVSRRAAASATQALRTDLAALLPEQIWQESSAHGLAAVVGRDGRQPYTLALDDTTPHLLLAGRSGAGKTNVLLVLLYALAARYSPTELGMYLLDFKEGVSFVEFTPTAADPSWVPHAQTVGVESDREYGLAVLRALAREMNRRAGALKQAGVTKLADLRAARPDAELPRLVVVIDEFQVLLAGNDPLARDAVAALEDLARRGRSYGIHLILASQTIAGIEALYTKRDSIFGQFPLRIALAGGAGILEPGNTAADALPVGTAVVNPAGGVAQANQIVRFPHADAASLATARHALWQARGVLSEPPAVFAGYAEHHVDDDPLFAALQPGVRRRQALVGRAVEVGLPTVGFALDAVPGRHVAVLGTSMVGADMLHAATMGLARQHNPGSARFVIACFAAAADPVVDDLVATLTADGHDVIEADAGGFRTTLAQLAAPGTPSTGGSTAGGSAAGAQPAAGPAGGGQPAGAAGGSAAGRPTYLVVFAADVVVPMLNERGQGRATGVDDLRAVLRQGPTHGVHMLGWWRATRRFSDVIGGSAGREDVACLVALNVLGNELALLVGDHTLVWQPRPNRALLLDRHDQRQQLFVPFVRPGRLAGD